MSKPSRSRAILASFADHAQAIAISGAAAVRSAADALQLAAALACLTTALCAVDWRLGIGVLGAILLLDHYHGRRQGSAPR